jgi:hypothetical protein
MAVDLGRKRLLVAALGNGTLEIVDLVAGHRIKQITGLHEPQGVGYAQRADLVAVASAGDGSVRLFRGEDLAPAGSLALGNDADNVRIDPRTGNVIVGYGSGGLAVIDPEKIAKIGDIKLAAHPESFQLDPGSGRVFVNVPDAGQIAVVDLETAKEVASLTVRGLGGNFPLAIDGSGTAVAAVFRHPAKARPARRQDRRRDTAAGHLRGRRRCLFRHQAPADLCQLRRRRGQRLSGRHSGLSSLGARRNILGCTDLPLRA